MTYGGEQARVQASGLTNIANTLFAPGNAEIVQTILEATRNNQIGAVIADIDGTLGKLPPGQHILSAPVEAAEAMITMARFFPTGILTGRPHKVVETGFPGLLDTEFGFAGTEAGARLVTSGHKLVYERSIGDITYARTLFEGIMSQFPGGIVEEHTLCSIICGITKVDQHNHHDVFYALNAAKENLDTPENPIGVVSGNKPGINVHYNVVPAGIDKGYGIAEIYRAMNIQKIGITLGDDKADAPMFKHVKMHGGYAIGVGTNAPECDIRLNEPAEAVQLLKMMAAELSPRL